MTEKQHRGFAAMDPARQREIASMGGVAAHRYGSRAHEWTSAEAKLAGRKGGLARQAKKPAPPAGPTIDEIVRAHPEVFKP